MNKSIVMSLSAFLACGICNAQMTVPHTFTSGSTAKASEVNSNFNSVEQAINSNTDAIAENTGGLETADTRLSDLEAKMSSQTPELSVEDASGQVLPLNVDGWYQYLQSHNILTEH